MGDYRQPDGLRVRAIEIGLRPLVVVDAEVFGDRLEGGATDPQLRRLGGSSSCATGGSTRLNGWSGWIEPVPGYPRRPVPRDEDAAKALRKRTLTNLYNARPQWLADANAALDAAVAGAYGWPAEISGDDAIRELLALNRNE